MDEETPGSSCFVSDHPGFYGTIKNSTSDFVVTEKDINGQFVNKLNSDRDCALNDELPQYTVKGDNHCNFHPDKLTSIEVSCESGESDIQNQECFDLSIILDPSVNEALEHFTRRIRAGSSPREGEKPAAVELSLGKFPDKHQRASVHRAVRHNFPFLMTLTNQTEIIVKEDPDFKELSSLVSEEEAEDFFRFVDAKKPISVFTFMPDGSKEHRTAVHHFLSRRFGKLVETKSFTDPQHGTAITVRLRERGRTSKKRTASDLQQEEVTYTAFTLRKENLETLEAISYMATALGVLPSDFTYAGIKDKRAITYQSMVVKKVPPERLTEKVPEFERRGIQLSLIRRVSEPLQLGRLGGNHFDIIIRDLRPHAKGSQADLEKLVSEAVENVKVRGFVNYFGPQRFGSGQSVQADRVGLALLKEEMVNAVRLFFTPDSGDDLQNQAKRHFLDTENAKESLVLMPAYKARERLMLRALHRYGTGHEGSAHAWLSLPHGMRIFYLHAYCSRVWNEAAEARLLRLSHRAVQGDLVLKSKTSEQTGEVGVPQIHVVSAEEERDNVFTLGQVVLPMPGNSVKYPENELGQWYKERLAQDGLQSCRFRVTALKLNVPGCYRPLLAFPHNMTYTLHGSNTAQTSGQPQDSGLPYVSLSFNLDASCYATVCLRELMKKDL